MPTKEYKGNERFRYHAAQLIQNRRVGPALVPAGEYVRLTGVDGRFMGGFRRFPGFKQVLDLSTIDMDLDDYDGSEPVDMSGMKDVWFFKPLAVQVVVGTNYKVTAWKQGEFGLSGNRDEPVEGGVFRVLRGFVVAHTYVDDSGETDVDRGVFRFVYYDTLSSTWKSHVLLYEVADDTVGDANYQRFWIAADGDGFGDGVILEDTEYDVASMGPFIYFTVNRASRSGINDSGVGSTPRDHYRRSVRVSSNPDPDDVNDPEALDWHYTNFGPTTELTLTASTNAAMQAVPAGLGGLTPEVNYIEGSISCALRTFCSFKNVRGPLVGITHGTADLTVNPALLLMRYYRTNSAFPHAYSDNYGTDDEYLRTRIRVYRSLDSAVFDASDVGTLIPSTLFEEQELTVRISRNIAAIDTGPPSNLSDISYKAGEGYDIYVGVLSDSVLASSGRRIDPYDDDTAYCPTFLTLLMPYQGTLLRVGSMPKAAEPATTVDREQILSWGSLSTYAPEECRVQDATPLGSEQDERILAMVKGGDYVFVVGDSSVFKIRRNGKMISINEVESLAGGVGRYACLGLGTSLVYVLATGVAIVDGPSGEYQLVAALDRVIQEDWKDTLSYIRMTYDSRLGALFIFNADTSFQEAVVMWSNTGAITTLKDLPFAFCGHSVNPEDAGVSRSFWITSDGIIYTPNANREDGTAMTMCGGTSSKTWNATVDHDNLAPGGHSNVIALLTPYYDADGTAHHVDLDYSYIDDGLSEPELSAETNRAYTCVGFKLYAASGENIGESQVITSIVGNEITVESSFTYEFVEGDTVSIAPVPFEVIGWPIQDGTVGIDLFNTKLIKASGLNVNLLGGETDPDLNPNLVMDHKIYDSYDLGEGDQLVRASGRMSAEPGENYVELSYRKAVMHPAWMNLASNVDIEVLGFDVRGDVTESESASINSPGPS